MEIESRYYYHLKNHWNIGISYQLNEYVNLATQFLHGDQLSFTATLAVNPSRPPLLGGKELAPVPMRKRAQSLSELQQNNEITIRKVLAADNFKILHLKFSENEVRIDVENNKFRSTTQAIGRISSTLQRFTSDSINIANIAFHNRGLQTASYRVNLDEIAYQQFASLNKIEQLSAIEPLDLPSEESVVKTNNTEGFSWGIGPYVTHRLFNPDLPLSAELGLGIEGSYQFLQGVKLTGALRKSVLTNLTDNERRSNSVLPRVHSDWPLYDFAGQNGHIHTLTLSYVKNLAPGFYGKAHAGLLEPFFAGIGGELLYKPIKSPIAVGLDVHRVRKRDYDMLFDLRDYETTVGHLSLYFDAGGIFDVEINAGKYLAGDFGATTTISRKFGSGWEVGGYATLTDVPFATFGEGSFDKAIYVSIPIDWIISSPSKAKRRLTLRPITRDGGANLASARSLYGHIKGSQNAQFRREYGRLWK